MGRAVEQKKEEFKKRYYASRLIISLKYGLEIMHEDILFNSLDYAANILAVSIPFIYFYNKKYLKFYAN